jgi:hypothetical protein
MLNHFLPPTRSVQFPAAVLGALAIAACGSSQSSSTTTVTRPGAAAPSSSQATPTSPHPAAASPQPVPLPCAGPRLRLSAMGTQGATGHLEVTFALRNDSGTFCTLRGYPGARLLDATGQTIAMRLERGRGFFPDTMIAPRRVLLAPSASARFGLSFVTNNEYAGARRCVRAWVLEAVPPGGSGPLRVSLSDGGLPQIVPCGRRLVTSPLYDG